MKIDFHAHILPGADHGSDSLETSRYQLSSAAAAGVSTVVAAAHFYPGYDSVARFLARRAEALSKLEADGVDSPVHILPGAEVALYEGMEHMEGLEGLCIGESNAILLEMPMGVWSEQLLETVYEIGHVRKLSPVMAHIDRYPPQDVERLLSIGVAAQVNTEAICSLRTRRRCFGYVKRGLVWALGSDIHGKSDGYFVFQKALRLLGTDAEFIMGRSAALLSDGQPELRG